MLRNKVFKFSWLVELKIKRKIKKNTFKSFTKHRSTAIKRTCVHIRNTENQVQNFKIFCHRLSSACILSMALDLSIKIK